VRPHHYLRLAVTAQAGAVRIDNGLVAPAHEAGDVFQ
jgi:hypothetical protein